MTLAILHFGETAPPVPVTRFNIDLPPGTRVDSTPPAISPDGKLLAFGAVSSQGLAQLWMRPLDSLASRPLPGTENATFPFWSPDSRAIGFFAGGKLKRLEISGGAPTALADAPDARGGTWGSRGEIVFIPAPFGGFQQVSAVGGPTRAIALQDPKQLGRFPWFLPDGRHFLYLSGAAGSAADVRLVSLDSPAAGRTLVNNVDGFAVYSQAQLLYLRGSTLVARPFDESSLQLTGEPQNVAEDVLADGGRVGESLVSVSAGGVLVYRSGVSQLGLTWFDRQGRRVGGTGEAGRLTSTAGAVHFAPDRRLAAIVDRESASGNFDIWIADLSRGLRTRFTFDAARDGYPVWSPDGRTIVFRSTRGNVSNMFRKPTDGSRNEELLLGNDRPKIPSAISPDSKYLAYATSDPQTGIDIWMLPMSGNEPPFPFVRTPYNEQEAQFSPDGNWVAYQSNESGSNEIYVGPFPGPGGKRQISKAGGVAPRWRPDGRELYYLAPGTHLMAAEVEAKGGAFEVKRVEALFGMPTSIYDVSADGRQFLVASPPEGDAGGTLTVVQNWLAGVKK